MDAAVGTHKFIAKAYNQNQANGTKCDTDQFHITVIDSGTSGEEPTPPSTPVCDSGDFLWTNNIDVNNLSGNNGIPQSDIRLIRNGTMQYSIPNIPAALNQPITLVDDEPIDGSAETREGEFAQGNTQDSTDDNNGNMTVDIGFSPDPIAIGD